MSADSAPSVPTPHAATPLANQLLIALPSLQDGNFARSVALICQHDDDGAMGIVVNRASEYTLGEVLGQMGVDGGAPEMRGQVVLAGGPVHPERGFVLHDGGLRCDGPPQAIVALGCAGWGAGQLEQELTENDWLTAPADAELLFSLPLDHRWEAAAGRIGVDFAHLADYAGHA